MPGLLPPGKAASGRGGSLLYRDIHAPIDLLPDLAAARSRGRELILLTANWKQYDLAVNLIAGLAAHGLDNYMLLCDNAQLVQHAKRRGAIAAVWSSMLERFAVSPDPACECMGAQPDWWSSAPPMTSFPRRPGNFPCGQGTARTGGNRTLPGVYIKTATSKRLLPSAHACEPSAAVFYQAHAVRRLWLMRFYYTERLIGGGYNVLLLDSDSLVLANPYPFFHKQLGAVSAIGLEDVSAWPQMTLNGGTWYFRARPNGPLHYMLRRFTRRAMRLLRSYPAVKIYDEAKRKLGRTKSADFLLFDQTILNAVLVEALIGHSLELNSSAMVIPIKHTSPDAKHVRWISTCCHPAPSSLGHPPWQAPGGRGVGSGSSQLGVGRKAFAGFVVGTGSNRSALAETNNDLRGETKRPYGRATMLRHVEVRDGHGGKPETLVKAPAWLFSSESDVSNPSGRTAATFWGAWPPPSAVIHFVCTSWPGSDGRRAAMRLWGQWRARDIEPEVGASPQRHFFEGRRRAFVTFDAPVDAIDPKSLEPYLRLLTLVAHATRRTPVLPTMRCGARGQTWVEQRIDARTGELQGFQRKSPRPCGWAAHTLGGEALPEPLCIQRPLEGCFYAFATPDELTPHLPRGYWSSTTREFCPNTNASAARGDCGTIGQLPRVELPLPVEQPGLTGTIRKALSMRSYAEITLSELSRVLQPHTIDPATQYVNRKFARSRAPLLSPAPVLFLKTPDSSALRQQRLLSSLSDFDAALKRLKDAYGTDYLTYEWSKCLKMVRNNKCTAVC